MLLSHLGRAGAQWVLLWVVAVVGGPATVGEYSLALAIATPVFILCELSLRNVYVTLQRPLHFSSYVWVRSGGLVVAVTALAAAIALGLASPWILILVGLNKVVDSFVDLAYGALQRRAMLRTVAWTSLLNSVVSVAAGAAAYLSTRQLELALLGSILGSLITAIIVIASTVRIEPSLPAAPERLSRAVPILLRSGLPSGSAYAAVAGLTYLPFYLLATAGEGIVGVFATIAYFPLLANLFYASVQQTTLHSFVTAHRDGGRRALINLAARLGVPLLLTGLGGAWVTVAWGAAIIPAIYGPAFEVTPADMAPIAASIVFLPFIYVFGSILMTINRYGAQLVIALVALGTAVAYGIATAPATIGTACVVLLIGTATRAVLGGVVVFASLRSEPMSGRG